MEVCVGVCSFVIFSLLIVLIQGDEQSKETWRVSGGKLKLVDDKEEDNNNESSEVSTGLDKQKFPA